MPQPSEAGMESLEESAPVGRFGLTAARFKGGAFRLLRGRIDGYEDHLRQGILWRWAVSVEGRQVAAVTSYEAAWAVMRLLNVEVVVT